MAKYNRFNKYSAKRTYSELCMREFDSKAEAQRGEELCLLARADKIKCLEYQVMYHLYEKPSIKVKLDFRYVNSNGELVVEDVKGILEREFRVKLAWLKEKHNVGVRLLKKHGKGWDIINLSSKVIETI